MSNGRAFNKILGGFVEHSLRNKIGRGSFNSVIDNGFHFTKNPTKSTILDFLDSLVVVLEKPS